MTATQLSSLACTLALAMAGPAAAQALQLADIPGASLAGVDVSGADVAGADGAAQAAESTPPTVSVPPPASTGDFLADWERRADRAKATQPHWITPLATVTPRMEQEFRFDALGENMGNGGHLTNYDGGKGLELIPDETNEILINLPPYQVRSIKKPAAGLNDWSFLTVKQRFVSADEQHGDYIVSGFLGFQAPLGISAYTNHSWVVTPTLAAGKGWGRFDVQATLGVAVPLTHQSAIGASLIDNVALQYHLAGLFWPEIEFNTTNWLSGPRGGLTQVFVTPGVIIGRIPLGSHYKLIVGAGYQAALSPNLRKSPVLTPTYDNAWLATGRITF